MKLFKIFLLILFVLSGWLTLNCWLSFSHYNLYTDGTWQSGKTKLEKGVWGSWAMMFSNAALKGGKLNINAWHGYQEITLSKPVAAKQIGFTYYPANVPFSFILNKTDSGYTGIMFCPHGERKLLFYSVDVSGKFVSTSRVPLSQIPEGSYNSVKLSFTKDSVQVYINRVLSATFPFVSPPYIKPGFKGSSEYKDLYVDDVQIFDETGNIVLNEKFNYPFRVYAITSGYFFLGIVLLAYSIYRKEHFNFIIYIAFLLAVGIASGFAYYYYVGCGKYELNASSINWHGIKSSIENDTAVEERIARQYPVEQIAGKKPVVIVMGASQTWGAGASSAKTTFSAVLQDSLRKVLSDTNITVINVAVSAISPQGMYDGYMQKWLLYKPALLIINASNNDIDTTEFKSKLQAIVGYNKEHGIKTLLIEGPSDGSTYPCEKDICLRTLARENNLVSINMIPCMQQYADSGYLWWDAVHLSDYGHAILTNRILPFVVKELNVSSADSTSRTEFAVPIAGR